MSVACTHVEILVLYKSLLGQLRILAKDTPISRSTELHSTLVGDPSFISANVKGNTMDERLTSSVLSVFRSRSQCDPIEPVPDFCVFGTIKLVELSNCLDCFRGEGLLGI